MSTESLAEKFYAVVTSTDPGTPERYEALAQLSERVITTLDLPGNGMMSLYIDHSMVITWENPETLAPSMAILNAPSEAINVFGRLSKEDEYFRLTIMPALSAAMMKDMREHAHAKQH